MGRQEQEELRRLEAALLEQSCIEENSEEELEFLEHTWQAVSDVSYDAYNTDRSDVDPDAYSEDVYRGRRSNVIPALVTILALAVLTAMILWLLEFLGVM